MTNKTPRAGENALRIIPLGGVDEIGKNITVFEYGQDIVVVDCGLIFPQEDMLGIDYVIPDATYLVENKERIRGIVFTHGHEDHIGAVPYILPQLRCPIYGTRLTMALIENKMKENNVAMPPAQVVRPGDTVRLGPFTCEFIKVGHSIAGACAVALHTPAGVVVHTGDFKIDYTPIDGEPMNLSRLAMLGKTGVLAMLSDSTNVERPGYTMSERTVGETFNRLFAVAHGRIIIATFASNIHRVQQVVDSAARFGRKVCFSGRSMVNVATMAIGLGEMFLPEGILIEPDQVNQYEDHEVVIITTGSQGEAMSGLARMARGEHRYLNVQAGDTVIISATPIPGNEKFVSRLINQLYRQGAEVIYEALADVHVSGHARSEELKLVYQLVNPKYFIPVHGEYRHLMQHARLVESMGHASDRIFIPEAGKPIELTSGQARIGDPVPAGAIMVDGLGIGDVGNVVLRDRKHLSQDGLLVVVIAIDKETGELLAGPDIVSRGFVFVRDNEELIDDAKEIAKKVVSDFSVDTNDWSGLRNTLREELKKFVYIRTKRNPMILPVVEAI